MAMPSRRTGHYYPMDIGRDFCIEAMCRENMLPADLSSCGKPFVTRLLLKHGIGVLRRLFGKEYELMNVTTPALLFPAISLLLLAYTNRFMVLAQLIRRLHSQYQENLKDVEIRQISNLRLRIALVRHMQAFGVLSFILCALSMFLVLIDMMPIAQYILGTSIFFLILSLALSLYEIAISTDAIEIELEDIEQSLKKHH
jgi:hypothetical protein